MQQQPARQHRNHRFQAENQRRDRRVGIPLPDDLAGIRYTAAHHARVQDGHPRGQNLPEGRFFKHKHSHRAKQATGKKLDTGQLHPIRTGRKMVNYQDMHRKKQRAHHDQQITEGNRKSLFHTQQVHAHDRNPNREPDPPADALAEQQPEQRHKQDIQCGDKARLADAGILNAELLERACERQEKAAADTAGQQIPAGVRRRRRFSPV